MDVSVLVIGHRSGLSKALSSWGVNHFIWNDVPLKQQSVPLLGEHIQPFPPAAKDIEKVFESLRDRGYQFTHVIAGKESAVGPTVLAQHFFQARRRDGESVLRFYDKLLMKQFLHENAVPMTDYTTLERRSFHELKDAMGLPLVIKLRHSSGGKGVFFCHDEEDWNKFSNLQDAYVEKFVDGEEGSIESFVKNGEIVFSNLTQYFRKKHINLLPAQFPSHLETRVRDLNEKVLRAMGVEWGMTHLEFYYRDEKIYFGEVALRPPGGYIMELLDYAYGLNPWKLLLACELDLPIDQSASRKKVAAVNIFHPGEGTVKKISGINELESFGFIPKFKVKIGEGDSILRRYSVSEEVAHIFMLAEDHDQMVKNINAVESVFTIEME